MKTNKIVLSIALACGLYGAGVCSNNLTREQWQQKAPALFASIQDLYREPVVSGSTSEKMSMADAKRILVVPEWFREKKQQEVGAFDSEQLRNLERDGYWQDGQLTEKYFLEKYMRMHLALQFHSDKPRAKPEKILEKMFMFDVPVGVIMTHPNPAKGESGKEFKSLQSLSSAQLAKVTRKHLLDAAKTRAAEVFKVYKTADEAIKSAVDANEIYRRHVRTPGEQARQDDWPDEVSAQDPLNEEWRKGGYVSRLSSHLSKRPLVDKTQEMAEAQDWYEKTTKAIEKIKSDNTTHDTSEGKKDSIAKNEKIKAPKKVKAKDIKEHNAFAPRRWWQATEAFGANPSLLTDAADLLSFTSPNKKAMLAGTIAAGIGRVVDTGLNKPFAHSALSDKEAETYIPVEQRAMYNSGRGQLNRFKPKYKPVKQVDKEDDSQSIGYIPLATRNRAAAKQAGMFPAQALGFANTYVAQPLSLLTDTGYTLLNHNEVGAYNKYLASQKKKNAQLAKYMRGLRNKRIGMGGMMALEAALNAAKYALYLRQQRDPSKFYSNQDDAKLVEWSNRASALAAALSLARRGWWNWTKSQHIERAQQHAELEQYRDKVTTQMQQQP